MDNWQGRTETARGVVARRYPLNMQMGLGHEGFDHDMNARISDHVISEMNQRAFYGYWAHLMDGRVRP